MITEKTRRRLREVILENCGYGRRPDDLTFSMESLVEAIEEVFGHEPVVVIKKANSFQFRVMEELHLLDEDYCTYAKTIASILKCEISQVRRALRVLCKRGLVELVRGLTDDDGLLHGSGYRLTDEGRTFFEESMAKA